MVRGCLATSCVVVGDCRLYWWWPLAVAGEVGEFHVFSCRVREGGLRSPEESGVALDRQREVYGTFR